MKTSLKSFVIALCCVLCFSPFSIHAEEDSSSFQMVNGNIIIFDGSMTLEQFKTIILNSPYDLSDTFAMHHLSSGNIYFIYAADSFDSSQLTNFRAYVYLPSGSWSIDNYGNDLNISSANSEIYFNSLPHIDGSEFIVNWNATSYEDFCDQFYSDITVSADPSNGGVVSGSGRYLYDDYFTVTATPNEGYELEYWEWIHNGVSDTWDPWPSWTNKSVGDEHYIAHFKYTGLTPPSPTSTPTPTPEPDEPLYEMSTDFKYLLSNPAIASLVQYAVNDLSSNTWWIERELYYYEAASCPSDSTPLYSEFGYVERFVLYNYTSNGLEQISDSINHQGQSSLGCLISSGESSVIIPQLESSPTITETLFFGFDLFEIPEADFYQLLVQIKNTLADSSVSNSINNVNNSIVSGNGISQNVTSSLVDENSSLNSSIDSYDAFESQFNDDLTSSLSNINLDSVQLGNSSDFVKTASWVKVQFDHILDSSGLYKTAISFVLIVGLALLLIGRRL